VNYTGGVDIHLIVFAASTGKHGLTMTRIKQVFLHSDLEDELFCDESNSNSIYSNAVECGADSRSDSSSSNGAPSKHTEQTKTTQGHENKEKFGATVFNTNNDMI
jgi:hypothetical protein